MGLSKASRLRAFSQQGKDGQSFKSMKGNLRSALYSGSFANIPHNRRLRQFVAKRIALEQTKVIVLNVDNGLDQGSLTPLNRKAETARQMFIKYRNNH